MITKEYQFPKITNEMHEEIAEWYESHNGGKCANFWILAGSIFLSRSLGYWEGLNEEDGYNANTKI